MIFSPMSTVTLAWATGKHWRWPQHVYVQWHNSVKMRWDTFLKTCNHHQRSIETRIASFRRLSCVSWGDSRARLLICRSCCSVGRCQVEGRRDNIWTSPLSFLFYCFSASWRRWYVSKLAVASHMLRRQNWMVLRFFLPSEFGFSSCNL